MKYYKTTCGKMIQHNPETKVYKIQNDFELKDKRISFEDFNKMDKTQLKKNEWCRLMNIYYKDIKHEWIHDGKRYRKLPNFQGGENSICGNYILGKQIPLHTIENKSYLGNMVLVYHHGKVYYHTISYGGYKQGMLLDPYTLETVQWAQLKHCAPILNVDTNKIV